MLDVDATSFLVIVAAAAAAGTLAMALAPRLAVPVVVIELVLGILIGPQLLELASVDDFTEFFSNLGLGMLFFFAGYEIDFRRVVGSPLRLAAIESEVRKHSEGERIAGLLPEGRAAVPTGRNILAAFQGLGLTYTTEGIALDRLTATQRHILELLEIEPPWTEQGILAA